MAEKSQARFDLRIGRMKRQVHHKLGAHAFRALRCNRAAVLIDDLAYSGEPDSRAGYATGHIRASVKPTEDVRKISRRNPDTPI